MAARGRSRNSRATRYAEALSQASHQLEAQRVARIFGITVATAKQWLSGNRRIPRHAQAILSGDLGAFSETWEGWRLSKDCLITPNGLIFSQTDLASAEHWQAELLALRDELAKYQAAGGLVPEEQPVPDRPPEIV